MTKEVKFQIGDLLPIGMTFVVTGIAIAFGLQVMGETKNEGTMADCSRYPPASGYTSFDESTFKCSNGTASIDKDPISPQWNASKDGLVSVSKIPEKMGTIVTVVLAAVILGVLLTYLAGRFR